MKLIFALGNPGSQYDGTRHNVGFAALDIIASQLGTTFTEKTKFQSVIAEMTINGEKILFAKPTTFYNETGIAARTIVDFYKLTPATDMLVIHDELALPFGTIKTRRSGSDAGNNGIKSLNTHIGQEYARIRVGILNPFRDQADDANFVLGRFTHDERQALPNVLSQANGFVDAFIHGAFEPTKVTSEH